MKYTDYIKCIQVICSCRTFEQLEVAKKYVQLAAHRKSLSVIVKIYTVYIIKFRELENEAGLGWRRC